MPFNHGLKGCFADLNTNKTDVDEIQYDGIWYNGIESDITGIVGTKTDSDGITIYAKMGD